VGSVGSACISQNRSIRRIDCRSRSYHARARFATSLASMSNVPTNAQSYLYFGDLYIAAAFQIARHSDTTFMPPLLQLFGTGIELTLKAYLVHVQVDARTLKRIGHQLGDGLDLALAKGLGSWEPRLGLRPAPEIIHGWATLYAGDKSGPNKNHRRLVYPVSDPQPTGFGVGDTGLARLLVRSVARATGLTRMRLHSLDLSPKPTGTMASLVEPDGLYGG